MFLSHKLEEKPLICFSEVFRTQLGGRKATWDKWQKDKRVDAGKELCWKEWWIHQKSVLPFSMTWTGWKVGQRGT